MGLSKKLNTTLKISGVPSQHLKKRRIDRSPAIYLNLSIKTKNSYPASYFLSVNVSRMSWRCQA
jgi:hypothetical protein